MDLLVVEDNPADLEILRRTLEGLEGAPSSVRDTDCLAGSIDEIRECRFDAVLLDLSLPDSDGLETLSALLEAGAEDTGLISRIGTWVLEEACRQMASWTAAGTSLGSISVNVSTRQFWQDDFQAVVERALDRFGVSGQQLNLEITESCLMSDVEATARTLANLREFGIRISIDDFGTGYSSLSVLKRLPLDRLKIGRCFVGEATGDPSGATIARAIIGLAHNLELETVAEGVETEEQLDFLLEQGCRGMQGYLFSQPLPVEKFDELLQNGAPLLERKSHD